MSESPSMTIGLVGGIASGKSLVAQQLAERGAMVLAADEVAHGVLADPEVRQALVARWGEGILTSTGDIDRHQVANRVFGDNPQATEERQFLEGLVHPRTRQRLEDMRERGRREGFRVFVIDAPLLLEAGWGEACDWILFVDTPRQRRLAFAIDRGWEPGELARRERVQLPIEAKRARADWVIDNAGDHASLARQVDEFCQRLIPAA